MWKSSKEGYRYLPPYPIMRVRRLIKYYRRYWSYLHNNNKIVNINDVGIII